MYTYVNNVNLSTLIGIKHVEDYAYLAKIRLSIRSITIIIKNNYLTSYNLMSILPIHCVFFTGIM